jgi:hypothetical protein
MECARQQRGLSGTADSASRLRGLPEQCPGRRRRRQTPNPSGHLATPIRILRYRGYSEFGSEGAVEVGEVAEAAFERYI